MQKLDAVKGCIAKPRGWFYSWSGDANRVEWIIARENVKVGRYETGMRIYYIHNLSAYTKDYSPESFARQVMSDKKRGAQKIIRECSPVSVGPFTRTCLETSERIESTSGTIDYRILYSLFWSNEKNAFLISTFGTPAGEWEKNLPVVDVMSRFVLHCERCCETKDP